MTGEPAPPPGRGQPKGCLRSAAGVVALTVLAPFALAVRAIRARRRGTDTRIERTLDAFAVGDGGSLIRIDTSADVPVSAAEGFRRRLTDTIVRIAEAVRRPDDVYHLLYRDRSAAETIVLPVGPQLQELGERFHLVLTEGVMAGRTVVWLTLSRGRRLVEFVDPFAYDPEDPGEPEPLFARSGMHWGMATAFHSSGPAVLLRLVLYIPPDSIAEVEALLDRLSG